MLKRYWFVLEPEYKFGPLNIGVTAASVEEAKSLAIERLSKIGFSDVVQKLEKPVEVIENIDIRLLDQNHIIPNMGVVVFKGVWWPGLNM